LNGVAGVEPVVLVVSGIFLRMRDELLIHRVHHSPLDTHDYCLIADVTDDDPWQHALRHSIFL